LNKAVLAATVSAKDVRFVKDGADNRIADIEATTVELGGDALAPSVATKLAADATEITANGKTTALKLSEEVDAASKTALENAVKAALTKAGDAEFTVAWNADKVTLEITVSGVAVAADKVTIGALTGPITVKDLAGNSATLTVADLQN